MSGNRGAGGWRGDEGRGSGLGEPTKQKRTSVGRGGEGGCERTQLGKKSRHKKCTWLEKRTEEG